MILPLILLRGIFNLRTYNKIYRPDSSNISEYGTADGIACMVIFWWIKREDDPKEITKSKKTSNIISIISILITFICGFLLTYLSK
jgi:hypothetical protein